MNLGRLRELLVGHALAEGRPLGATLRQAGGPRAAAAAVEADAGRLERSLLLAGLAPDEARLAEAWPAALRPAQQRLARVPGRQVATVEVVETAAYLCLVCLLEGSALLLLARLAVPTLQLLGSTSATGALPVTGWFLPVGVALVVAGPLLLATAVLGMWFPALHPGLGRHLQRAREAALAAALRVSDAPLEARRAIQATFGVLEADHASAEELDAERDRAITRADASRRRLVALLRGVGLTLLCALAAGATAVLYGFIASMPP